MPYQEPPPGFFIGKGGRLIKMPTVTVPSTIAHLWSKTDRNGRLCLNGRMGCTRIIIRAIEGAVGGEEPSYVLLLDASRDTESVEEMEERIAARSVGEAA